jgi:putative addiction module component (TIGR02574 family)
MAKTLEQVSNDAAELPGTEKLKLARLLIELSEEPENSAEAEMEWDAEIRRRLQELRAGTVKAIPLDEVKRRMQRHLVRED